MAEVIYLAPDEQMPDLGEDDHWLAVDASDDARFFGSGFSLKASGEWVGYCSLAEDDVSLEKALAAAQDWAEEYEVPLIWVQLAPYVANPP
jgi:hypothetical protein